MVTSYRTGRTSRTSRTNREAPEGCSLNRLGIGHLRSGDRCTETRSYPLNSWRVAEQIPPQIMPVGPPGG